MVRALAATLPFVAAGFLTCPALACSYAGPPPFELRDDPNDNTPPAAPTVRLDSIKRGVEGDDSGCGGSASSCDDLGVVTLELPSDGEQDVGLVLEFSGDYPDLLRHQAGHPITRQPSLPLVWIDGSGDSEFDFEIMVWSVDRAGNMSETPARLRVEHGGSDGCNARARGGAQGGWLAALCALLFVRRYRCGTLPV